MITLSALAIAVAIAVAISVRSRMWPWLLAVWLLVGIAVYFVVQMQWP